MTRGQPCWQTVAIDYRVDFSSSNRRVTCHRLAPLPSDAGSMLMHAQDRGGDHLDGGIVGSGKCILMRPRHQPAATYEVMGDGPSFDLRINGLNLNILR
jgi:hypothetical protein